MNYAEFGDKEASGERGYPNFQCESMGHSAVLKTQQDTKKNSCFGECI